MVAVVGVWLVLLLVCCSFSLSLSLSSSLALSASAAPAVPCGNLAVNETWPAYLYRVHGKLPRACTVTARTFVTDGDILAIDAGGQVFYGDNARGILSVSPQGVPQSFLPNVTTCDDVGPLACYLANFSASPPAFSAVAWGAQASLLFSVSVAGAVNCSSQEYFCVLQFVQPGYVVVNDGLNFGVFDAASGHLVSTFALPLADDNIFLGSAVSSAGALVVISNNVAYAYSVQTGALLWSYPDEYLLVGIVPAVMSDRIVVTTGLYPAPMNILALDPATGNITWSVANVSCQVVAVTAACTVVCVDPTYTVNQTVGLFTIAMTTPPTIGPHFLVSNTTTLVLAYVDDFNTAAVLGYHLSGEMSLYVADMTLPAAANPLWSVDFAPAGGPGLSTALTAAFGAGLMVVNAVNVTPPVPPSSVPGGSGYVYFLGGSGGQPCPAVLPI